MTRSGFVLISCMSEEQNENTVWLNMLILRLPCVCSSYEVESLDFRRKALVKSVISEVPLEIGAKYLSRYIPGVVDVCRLPGVVDMKRQENQTVLLMFDE